MATICPEHDLLFLHCPRTGGTAISNALVIFLGGISIKIAKPKEGEIQDPRRYYHLTIFGLDTHFNAGKHADLSELLQAGAVTPEQVKQLTIFSTIRNPLDSFVSQYQKLVNGQMITYASPLKKEALSSYLKNNYSFSHFLRNYYPLLKAAWENNMRFVKDAKYIVRFDNLAQDFNKILQTKGIEPIQLTLTNATSNKKSYISYYSQEDLSFIGERDPHLLDYEKLLAEFKLFPQAMPPY